MQKLFCLMVVGALLMVAEHGHAAKKTGADANKFVAASKETILGGLKDPSSAQFKNLAIGEQTETREKRLCGFINSKNSYGGYVGFKAFWVKWDGPGLSNPVVWLQGESNTGLRASIDSEDRLRLFNLDKAEMDDFERYCVQNGLNKVTPVAK